MLGSILGPLYFGKLPHVSIITLMNYVTISSSPTPYAPERSPNWLGCVCDAGYTGTINASDVQLGHENVEVAERGHV